MQSIKLFDISMHESGTSRQATTNVAWPHKTNLRLVAMLRGSCGDAAVGADAGVMNLGLAGELKHGWVRAKELEIRGFCVDLCMALAISRRCEDLAGCLSGSKSRVTRTLETRKNDQQFCFAKLCKLPETFVGAGVW
jgi:hypothetical protein